MIRGFGAAAAAFSIVFVSIFISPSTALAAEAKIILFDAPHTDLLGASLNSELDASLLPIGRLGLPVFAPVSEPKIWLIDAALIDEISALAAKSPNAQNWLTQLKSVTAGDKVYAIPYGHPDLTNAKRLAPSELNYYYEASKFRLERFLGREVLITRSFRWTQTHIKIAPDAVRSYAQNRQNLALLGTVVPQSQLDTLRLQFSFLLSSDSTTKRQNYFAHNADLAVNAANHKLRIVPGKYRLTSQHEKVPITLVNDFAAPVVVTLQLTPLNSRIRTGARETVSLGANSKTQLSVPIEVIAPGSTAVLAEFRNAQGKGLGDSVILTLNASVISPTVAWFTTGAAVLLLLAAVAQSVRRVKRSRK